MSGKVTSLPFVLFSHWSIPNLNVHKQPEKHCIYMCRAMQNAKLSDISKAVKL